MNHSGTIIFTEESIQFLRDLSMNNDKTWFEANKTRYTEDLLKPAQSFVMSMGDFMLDIDPYLETTPAVGKTISRIYRDTRFSHDKSPFRSNIWITFKRPKKTWTDAPAFFFEITPEAYRYGMGFYSATKQTMDRFREMIDQNPGEFLRATSFYPNQTTFAIAGDTYKKTLDPSKPEEILDWYQRKNVYLVCIRSIDQLLFSDQLVQQVKDGFGQLAELYHYFFKARIESSDCV